MNHPQHLTFGSFERNFPRTPRYPRMWASQREILEFVADNQSATVESPTGSGKTAVEYTILKAIEEAGGKNNFLITPNKTILQQIANEFPDLAVAMGRSEHPCLFYEPKEELTPARVLDLPQDPKNLRADEVPCSFLTTCPHRVDQTTGRTFEEGAFPCPYLMQKYQAKQKKIVLSTMAFYLFTQLFSKEWEKPDMLVVDEGHRFAQVVRDALSYEITDYHLKRSVELLESIGAKEAVPLRKFLRKMLSFIKKKLAFTPTLLEAAEIRALMEILSEVDPKELSRTVGEAIKNGLIDVTEKREVLKKLEVLIRDFYRYMRSFEYSLATEERGALNYTYAFYKEEIGEKERVQYKLVIKCYYVAPIIKKILGHRTVVMSATIGNTEVFGHETGIKAPVKKLGSNFPNTNTRLYMPNDTANLAQNARSRNDLNRSLRLIARTAKKFAEMGHRSLLVTISNLERDKFIEFGTEAGLQVISYGNGVTARDAALTFKDGEGDILVGTASNYAEGIDLPKQVAPVIFFLRPGYPNPTDPGTQFEVKRFGTMRWALWNWRVMIQALQVRGRNIRSSKDIGVTFFISQQFRRFLRPSLPLWLEPAYRGESTFDECVADAMELLREK